MKKILCLLMTLSLCAIAHGESKTEVIVKKGLVKTTTARGDSLVSPGQKAVFESNQSPQVLIENQMVRKLLELEKNIQKERAERKIDIRVSSVQACSVENENLWKVGVLTTLPNKSPKAETVCRIGQTTLIDDVLYFGLDGSPLSYTTEKTEEKKGYYYLTFPKAIPSGEFFQFIMISDFQPNTPQYQLCVKQEGQWNITLANDTAYCLNFFYILLPKNAIFVKSQPDATAIEEIDGQVAVTIRNYTGKEANGTIHVSFLWPQKGDSYLEGIPWDKAGPEAVKIYELFIRENIQSPELWGELGIKLIGGRFHEQAYDAFERCHNGHTSAVWDYTALTWQGHLLDLEQERAKAVEKYQQALAVKPEGDMRHDQWGIVLDKKWIQRRIEAPFTENMLFYPELNYREPPLDSAIETGVRVGDIPLNITKDEVLKKLGEPKTIFYREQSYTLNDLPEKYYFVYPDISLMIIDSRVKEITTRSSFYHFPNGIKTGDSEQEVIKAFGTKYKRKETSIKIYLEYEDLKLMFEVEKPQMQVVEINVGPLQ